MTEVVNVLKHKLPLGNRQRRHLLATFSNLCLECEIIQIQKNLKARLIIAYLKRQ